MFKNQMKFSILLYALKIYISYIIFLLNLKILSILSKTMNKNNLLRNHKKLIYKYYTFDNNYTFFNINYLIFFFSFKFKTAKVEYRFGLYDNNSNLIIPSENRLYKNISIMCHIKVENKNINIESLAGIYKDKYYRCIDFFNINEKINFGIK